MWHRYRFFQPTEDYRPISFPPPGPYWCSGYRGSDDAAVIVAYLPAKERLEDFWPEAQDIDFTVEDRIVFTDRFAKPDWYAADASAHPEASQSEGGKHG